MSAGAASPDPFAVLLDFVSEILFSAALGVVLGHVLPFVIGWILQRRRIVSNHGCLALLISTTAFIMRTLFYVTQRLTFAATGWALFFEEETDEDLGWKTWQNPLICCMVAGFVMVNYTRAGAGFEEVVADISGPMYLLFFTYTGAGMDVIMLYRNIGAMSFIFITRAVLIVFSTRFGGFCASSPVEHSQRYWMSFLTQASGCP